MSFIPPQSPMKRPEPMAIDHHDTQSPSAKRRSLHGPSTGLDFSIFESESPNRNVSRDENDWLRNASPAKFSTIPRRSTSLRKSTIQQRQSERASIKFSQPSESGSWFDSTPIAKNEKSFRMSLDNHLAPMPRESPFSAQGHLISASIHPATSAVNSQTDNSILQARHPLSRTMTQSSSQSSVQDDSPTHEPFHRPFKPASFDFSKSLPIGATRPSPSQESSQNSHASFATPATYKSAKPLPAAFMSTGLISKKNRNIDEPNAGLPKAHMPDTPCKKQSVMFPPDVKPNAGRNRVSFGTPATPAEPQAIKPLPFAKSIGLFGTRPTRPSLMRKASFASIDFDDKRISQSPTQRNASQSTTESDLPPTPTKHFDEPTRGSSISPSPHHGRNLSVPLFSGSQFASSKLSPIKQSPESIDEDSDGMVIDSPSANLSQKLIRKASRTSTSFTRTRGLKDLSSPTPLKRSTLALSSRSSPVLKLAKNEFVSPVTPLGEKPEPRFSPHTPQESVFPPDPSGLTISGRGDRFVGGNGIASHVPATPTGPREYFPKFSNRPSLDLKHAHVTSVDDSLMLRFEKVDLIGTGEFSQVYRVSKPPSTSPLHKIYASTTPRAAPQERVWAVKKSRHVYTGPRDRQRKLKEVEALKVLGRSDHVVHFVDSWENDSHLYIQTEFCEEGTLGTFIDQKGSKARLDDFRIWKIMLELSLVSNIPKTTGSANGYRASNIFTTMAMSTLT
jgi:mitosis inhibitor protein kinase SWE1